MGLSIGQNDRSLARMRGAAEVSGGYDITVPVGIPMMRALSGSRNIGRDAQATLGLEASDA